MSGPTTSRLGDVAAPELQISHRAPGLMLATFGEVFIAVWSTKPTRDLFELQRASLATAVENAPGRTFFLCVISPNAEPPDQAERDASTRMITHHGARLAGTACVIEGTGFRAAITRTVLTGIVLFARSPSPVLFFEEMDAAVQWMQRRSSEADLSQLAARVEKARFS
jgi:hypothetical protein